MISLNAKALDKWIDRLEKKPILVMLVLMTAHSGWMLRNWMDEIAENKKCLHLRIDDLKQLQGICNETIASQTKTIELQDTLLQYKEREKSRLQAASNSPAQ